MAASVKASQAGLEKIDQARRSKGWAKTESAWFGMAMTSEATLKRFWARKPVQQETFAAICQAVGIENWRTIADLSATNDRTISTLPPLPGIYQATTWVERISLTETLLPVLQSDRRIIVLTGMTGIGKTALAERLTLPLQDGKSLRRLNLDDGGITADFSSSGAALLRTLGEEPTLEDQKDAKNLLNHILDRLRTRPYRIQIDSLERLLAGDDSQGWSEFCDALWLDLWQQVLAGGECQSQIILTTQDVPGELEAIGSRYPQRWHCQPIRGLSEAEQLQLFQNHGIVAACNATVEAQHGNVTGQPLNVTADNAIAEDEHLNVTTHNAIAEAHNANAEGQHRIAGAHNATGANSAVSLLKRIGKLYEGHPLVLRVIAEDIKTCGGDVQRYWQQCRFAELEANRPAKFSRRALQLQVNQQVRDSLQRLPNDARHLLCRSAVYRRPVPESFWLALLPERTEDQQQAALSLLKARTFAEEDWEPDAWLGAEDEIPLRQHNLIRSVAYEMLKADSTWETAERQAAELWLTKYEPALDVANLEKVRGYLEAFHHFCEVKDWEESINILSTRISTSSAEGLDERLHLWGYYREQLDLYEKLPKNLDPHLKFSCLSSSGFAYEALGKYAQAIQCFKEALTIAIDDQQRQGAALGNLGNICTATGDYSQAVDYYERSLLIAQEIHDLPGQCATFGNLGNVHCLLGNYAQASEYIKQQIRISHTNDNLLEIGIALGNLGNIYDCIGDYEKALEYHKKSLVIAQGIGDRRGEGAILDNIGSIHNAKGDYEKALEYHEKSLVIAQEIDDLQGEGNAQGNIGISYYLLNKDAQAMEYISQHLRISREIGDLEGEGTAMLNLGTLLMKSKQFENSLELLLKSLQIFQKMICREGEAQVLQTLAELHQKTGSIDLARQYCDRALGLAIELGIPLVEECEELKAQLENER